MDNVRNTGGHVADLNDADLRTLVARFCLAELRQQRCPGCSVTAGGNQNAADGGLDVRVECPTALREPDFVPVRWRALKASLNLTTFVVSLVGAVVVA